MELQINNVLDHNIIDCVNKMKPSTVLLFWCHRLFLVNIVCNFETYTYTHSLSLPLPSKHFEVDHWGYWYFLTTVLKVMTFNGDKLSVENTSDTRTTNVLNETYMLWLMSLICVVLKLLRSLNTLIKINTWKTKFTGTFLF